MADFSNTLPDPIETARRAHGFSTPEDLKALDRLVALAARMLGGASLSLQDRGGPWYETVHGTTPESMCEARFSLEGTDVEGCLRGAGAAPEAVLGEISALVLELLKLRRLAAERRRQPRGPEGASFVPGVVHELRNFLFAMGAGLDAFEFRFPAQGEERTHAESLRRSLMRLEGFLDELQAYGDPSQLSFTLAPVIPVLGQALRLAEPLALARGVRLDLQEPGAGPLERMDPAALERALRNLLEMAALETREGGRVAMVAELIQAPGRPWLEVVIEGSPGRNRRLDPERLFEPFYYRDKAMSRLGPAIARRLVEAHGGRLAATGGEGLRLRLLLPVWPLGARETQP